MLFKFSVEEGVESETYNQQNTLVYLYFRDGKF